MGLSTKLKVAFIDPGGWHQFQEGLPNHPDIEEIHFNNLVCKNGKPYATGKSQGLMLSDIDHYDLIICSAFYYPWESYAASRDRKKPEQVRLIEKKKLWDRLVVIDFADGRDIIDELAKRCLVYFKKEWWWGERERPKKMYPLDHCCRDLMFEWLSADLYDKANKRAVNVGCFFGMQRGGVRGMLVKRLIARSNDVGSVDCAYTLYANHFHYMYETTIPLLENGTINWLYVYVHMMHRCKTIFTSSGTALGGDSRMYDAMTSGALVFSAKTCIPMPNQFEHGKHGFWFDFRDASEIEKAIDIASYYVKRQNQEERKTIAMAGYEHAKKYHSSKARAKYIMEIVRKELNR